MNREIKFRAWDSYNKIMINPYCELKDDNHFWGEDLVNTGLQTPVAVMQYTGLKDKNGKEIYEGDIVKTESNNYYEIIYHKDAFKLKHSFFGIIIPRSWDEFEVIGNIYENSELLEEAKK